MDLEKILLEQFAVHPHSHFVFEKFSEWEQGGQAKILRNFCILNKLPSIRFHFIPRNLQKKYHGDQVISRKKPRRTF